MRRTFGIWSGMICAGLVLGTTSCVVEEECEVVDLDLLITAFTPDPAVPAQLEFCDADGGPCVGAGGSIAFLPEAPDVESPTQNDLHGSATGRWDSTHFFAVGDAGTLLTVRDGYDGWQAEDLELQNDLYAVATRIDRPVVVAVGDGIVVRSEDAGESWTVDALPADMLVDQLVRMPDDTIVAGGASGQLWSTKDGANWTEIESPTQDPISAMYVGYGVPLLADAAGRVFEQDDEGTWQELSVPGAAPVVSFSGQALVWALRSDDTVAYRFLDEDWKRSDFEPEGGALMSAGEFDGYYYGYYYDFYSVYEVGWVQSVCVIGQDGSVHSASAWLEPELECRI